MNNEPTTLQEAIIYFSDPERAHNFMVEVRWPNGVTCPHCDTREPRFMVINQKTNSKKPENAGKVTKRFVWQCNGCRQQFTAKTGTIFEESPLGLDKWLTAMWMITNCKNGISSWEIHRAIRVTQKTAWFMLHRIR